MLISLRHVAKGHAQKNAPRSVICSLWIQVHDCITGKGRGKLPWERVPLDAAIRQQLGVFRKVVLQLLDRNPLNRPSMQDFCASCDRVFAQTQSMASSTDSGRLQVPLCDVAT